MFRQSFLIVPMLTSDVVCISFLLSGHQCRCVVIENKNSKKRHYVWTWFVRGYDSWASLILFDRRVWSCISGGFFFFKSRIALKFILTATLYQFLCLRISPRTSTNQLNHLFSSGIIFNFASWRLTFCNSRIILWIPRRFRKLRTVYRHYVSHSQGMPISIFVFK